MSFEKEVVLIQIMQLPIVLMLVYVGLQAITDNQEKDFNKSSFYDRLIHGFTKNKLKFISYAFLFNFIYLVLSIISTDILQWFNSTNQIKPLIIWTDLTTTLFFYLHVISYIKSRENSEKRRIHLLYFIILTSYFIVGLLTMHDQSTSKSIIYHIFNCIGFLLVTITLFKQLNDFKQGEFPIYANTYIAIGMSIWTVLQVFGLFPMDSSYINLWGFFLSLLGKLLILIGFYAYNKSVVSYSLTRLKETNITLEEQKEKINKINSDLISANEDLRKAFLNKSNTISALNQINRLDQENELIDKSYHFFKKAFPNLDHFTIGLIQHNNVNSFFKYLFNGRKVEHTSTTIHEEFKNSNFNWNEKVAVVENLSFSEYLEFGLEDSNKIEKKSSITIKKDSKTSITIPIFKREFLQNQRRKHSNDIPLGFFKISLDLKTLEIPIDSLSNAILFANNFAHPYYFKIFKTNEEIELNQFRLELLESETLTSFYRNVATKFASLSKCKAIYMANVTSNEEIQFINLPELKLEVQFLNLTAENNASSLFGINELIAIKDKYNKFQTFELSSVSLESSNLKFDKHYQKILPVGNETSNKLDIIIGLIFESDKTENPLIYKTLESKSNLLYDLHRRKMRELIIKKLMHPYNVFAETNSIFDEMTNVIGNFLQTNISFNLKVESKNGNEKTLSCLGDCPCILDLKKFSIGGKYINSTAQYFICNSEENSELFYSFSSILKSELKPISEIFILNTIIEGKIKYMSCFISLKYRFDLTFENKINFIEISKKVSKAIQAATLVDAIEHISERLAKHSYSKSVNSLLQEIVERAADVLQAEAVVFVPMEMSSNGNYTAYQKNIIQKGFKNYEYIDSQEEAYFVISLANDDSLEFPFILRNETEFESYCKKMNIYQQNEERFWEKEHIKSLVAYRIYYDDIIYGIILYEYRELTINSSNDSYERHLIKGFNNLIKTAITNSEKSKLLKNRNDQLVQLNEALTNQRKVIEEFNSIIMTRAAAASFFDISQAVHHDVYNYFDELEYSLMDVRKSLSENQKSIIGTTEKVLKIKQLIHGLLELTNFQNQSKEFLDVNDVILKVISFFKTGRSKKIKFITKGLSKNLESIKWNKAEFSMIIHNVISNSVYAIQSMNVEDKIFEIQITSKLFEDKKNKIKDIIITIEDDGPGIDKDHLPYIFDEGFSTKNENNSQDHNSRKIGGHGIGLYFVKNALFNEENDFAADILCESKLGSFTKFTINIPLYLNHK